MIFKENEWQIRDKREQIDDLYDYNEMVLEMLKPHYGCPNHIDHFKFYTNQQMLEMFQVSEKELHTISGCRHRALAAIFLAHPEYNTG